MLMWALALFSAAQVAAFDLGLRDDPIASGGSITYLDGESGKWSARAESGLSIPATVPGDIISDLHQAGVILDPYLDLTWIDRAGLWTNQSWTYSTNFSLPSGGTSSSEILLVFDSIKMGAQVKVNGHIIGVTSDQFLRYVFDLSNSNFKLNPSPASNTLEVTFGVDEINENGRFMPCTGGWDWAPYSYTFTNKSGIPTNTFSKGIVKSVYLVTVPVGGAVITHVTPHTRYTGDYPVTPLTDGNHGGFTVNVTTHLQTYRSGSNGHLEISGSWGGDVSTGPLSIPPGTETSISLQLNVSAAQVKLWWPAGVGEQPLYNITATWRQGSQTVPGNLDAPIVSTVRRFGFRAVAVVTVNDTDAAYVAANASADGTGKHGMFFRVNGAAIYSRGANMVPMEELEGRMRGQAHRILMKSSVDAGMNTLRVWGGGIFYPTEFYDAADEYGVLIYHDMMYNGNSGPHTPTADTTQAAELRHQIRRLSHHPAIVLWDSCNECVVTPNTTSEVYVSFVMSVVAQEDQSRAVWPSSPGPGWLSGVNRLYVTPNGSPSGLTVHGGGHIWNQGIETHAPYQLGSGWPTVNGGVRDGCFDNAGTGNGLSVPNQFTSGSSGGVAFKNIYASEFGTAGSSSFESMSGVLSPQHWGLHGGTAPDNCSAPMQCLGEHECTGQNPMAQRNYGCDGQIRLYWGNHTAVDLDKTGEVAFKGQLYQCQIIQAFVLKQVYEARRSQNQFGHLVWMLNEIWPTVGWGSLEYGPPQGYTTGQVEGGRWKPLHYFYRNSLMTDVMSTCGAVRTRRGGSDQAQCYISNHRASQGFVGTVTFTTYDHFGDGKGVLLLNRSVVLPEGPGAIEWFGLPGDGLLPPGNDTALISTVADEHGSIISEHMVQLVTPEFIRVPDAKINVEIADKANPDGTVDITVTSDKVALWVTLTTRAQGRFSDNAFFLPATSKTVHYVPFSSVDLSDDLTVLKESLRVEDYSMYRSL